MEQNDRNIPAQGEMTQEELSELLQIRRDKLKALQKKSEITEDDCKDFEKELQDLTDKRCKELDELAAKKEKELMAV